MPGYKLIQLTFLLMFLFMMTTGCSRDFNPATTILRHLIEKGNTQ